MIRTLPLPKSLPAPVGVWVRDELATTWDLRPGDVTVDGWTDYRVFQIMQAVDLQTRFDRFVDGRIIQDYALSGARIGDDGAVNVDVHIRPVLPLRYVKFTFERPEGWSDEMWKNFQRALEEKMQATNEGD